MQKMHGSFGEHAAFPPSRPASVAQSHSPPYSYPPTPHDWTRIQAAIYDYYVSQNLPLHDVRDKLQKHHGFKASDRMIKARLAKWEFSKNAKREDWGYLAILLDQRKRERKPTIFDVRGHRKTVRDLQRFIRNQNITPDKFLAESIDIFNGKGHHIPKHIRAYTPDAEDVVQSPLTEDSYLQGASPAAHSTIPSRTFSRNSVGRSVLASPDPVYFQDPAASQRDNLIHQCPYHNRAAEPNTFSPSLTQATTMSSKSASPQSRDNLDLYSCERTRLELETCSNQLLQPVPLASRIGHNDMRCWTIINNVASTPVGDAIDVTEHNTGCDHGRIFASLQLFEPKQQHRNLLNDASSHALDLPSSTRSEGSWVWVSLCFLACMTLTRGDEEYAQIVLDNAKKKFKRLLEAQDPLVLTAAGLMITILHTHDQGKIAVRILHSAKEVADEVLQDPDDPIRRTMAYLALTSDGPGNLLREAGLVPSELKDVHQRLRTKHGERHPYTIAAHHNYAWFLKWSGENIEAEKQARAAYEEAKAYFGVMHMQTMTSLSVTTGCIVEQKDAARVRESIQLYREIVENSIQILGVIHPYTLQAQRRLGHQLEKVPGQTNQAIKLHRTIVLGLATMLGRSHDFTWSQRGHYEKLLQTHGRWLDKRGRPSREQQEMNDLFSKGSEEAWELIETLDAFGVAAGSTSVTGEDREDEWTRSVISNIISRSRDPSPTSSMEHEAY